MSDSVEIGGASVPPGTRTRIEVPVARLPTDTWLSLPIEVVNGREPEPEMAARAAEHGVAVVVTPLPAFDAVGRLHAAGLRGRRAS